MSQPRRLLFLLNEPASGSERTYNALRLAHALGKRDGASRASGRR